MSNIKLSATRIDTFLSCKQKYWFSYYKKYPKVSNDSFKLGKAVHESLEFAGNIWLEKGKFTKKDKEEILKVYNEVSIREGVSDYMVHEEGKELVSSRLENFLCSNKLISLETKFGFYGKDKGPDIKSKYGVPLMGAIDKVEEIDEDTVMIIDYKTSKTTPTVDQARNNIQLSLYDLAARQLFPNYKRVVLALDLLKSNMVYTYRTDEERESFELYLKTLYDSMLNFKEEDAVANLNMFCPWCDFRDYCDTYKKACKKSDYKFLSIKDLTDSEIIEEWESIKSVSKILSQRENELSMYIVEKIKKNYKNIETEDGKELYIRQNSRVDYDLDTVYNAIPREDFSNVVNVNKKKLESYLNMNPAVKSDVMDGAFYKHTAPFIAVRNKKKIKK